MSLSLTTRTSGDVCFAAINGRMVLGPLLAKLGPELIAALGQRARRGVLIDLSQVTDIDSAGLGELVNIYKIATDRGTRIGLTGVNRRTREMLALTHLDGLLPAYETEADAEAALGGAG
jgi:anti-sigma B factor antagonist